MLLARQSRILRSRRSSKRYVCILFPLCCSMRALLTVISLSLSLFLSQTKQSLATSSPFSPRMISEILGSPR